MSTGDVRRPSNAKSGTAAASDGPEAEVLDDEPKGGVLPVKKAVSRPGATKKATGTAADPSATKATPAKSAKSTPAKATGAKATGAKVGTTKSTGVRPTARPGNRSVCS